MKVSLYIEKPNFDTFFVWVNRLSQGVLSSCPVKYSHSKEDFENPIHLLLEANEYAAIRDAVDDMNRLRDEMGGGDLVFYPEPLESEKILMQGILRNAQRYDLDVDVVYTALEVSKHIPGITPLEALVIAEREWVNVGIDGNTSDI